MFKVFFLHFLNLFSILIKILFTLWLNLEFLNFKSLRVEEMYKDRGPSLRFVAI